MKARTMVMDGYEPCKRSDTLVVTPLESAISSPKRSFQNRRDSLMEFTIISSSE